MHHNLPFGCHDSWFLHQSWAMNVHRSIDQARILISPVNSIVVSGNRMRYEIRYYYRKPTLVDYMVNSFLTSPRQMYNGDANPTHLHCHARLYPRNALRCQHPTHLLAGYIAPMLDPIVYYVSPQCPRRGISDSLFLCPRSAISTDRTNRIHLISGLHIEAILTQRGVTVRKLFWWKEPGVLVNRYI